MQPGPLGRTRRGAREEKRRITEIIDSTGHREKQEGSAGPGAESKREEKRRGGRSRGDAERRVRGRRAASEGGEGSEELRSLRWRINQLEKEKLKLMTSCNQEVCRLQAELARLRASVERGEAQRAELQYQLTASRRDGERVVELSRDRRTLTERMAELQQTIGELQKALQATRQAREEDQHALQQEVEERDRRIQSFSSENQRLHRVLQEQEEALEESNRRMVELQREREEEDKRQAEELKVLMEKEERRRGEEELWEQNLEEERAAHLQTRCRLDALQLQVRDLGEALAAERSNRQEVQVSLELLQARFREVERAYSLERERSSCAEHTLQRLQAEFIQVKSDMMVALETEKKVTSDLSGRLEEEKKRHADSQQAAERQSDSEEAFLTQIRETLQTHRSTAEPAAPAAKDVGKLSPAEVLQQLTTVLNWYQSRLEDSSRQVQDQLSAAEELQEELQLLQQLTSDQKRQADEARQASLKLEEEVARLYQEGSDWSMQNQRLQEELQKEKEELQKMKEELQKKEEELQKMKEGLQKKEEELQKMEEELQKKEEGLQKMKEEFQKKEEELQIKEEELQTEKKEKIEEVQGITDHFNKELMARLSSLHCLYQRLLIGCVLLRQPQSMLGDFTWQELCDVIGEQVDQLTSDLQQAKDKICHLQSVCDKKSVCVRRLLRRQECVLSRLKESVRRREEAWSRQHTHTVRQLQSQLQLLLSQSEERSASLTSDLSQLWGLLSTSRHESSSFLLACVLLCGALRHAHRCVSALRQQKLLLSRRLEDRELLEDQVRRLADALRGEEEEGGGRRRALRRWRRSVCAVVAMRRWQSLSRKTTVLFHLERGGGRVCVCGDSPTATQEGQNDAIEADEAAEGVCARWLHSDRLSSILLSSMSDLQGALSDSGSSAPHLTSAARLALSRLLDHLLDQSAPSVSSGREEDTLMRRTPPQSHIKTLVSDLQQHFLLFSQRLHSAEVERRSLRLEVSSLKRGLQREKDQTIPSERFHRVCEELRQALTREQEVQTLIQEQSKQLHTLKHTTQALQDARQEVSRKERSLRILGKHLSGAQKERRQQEERLQRAEEELRAAARRQECVICWMKAAETSCKQLRESLVQSQHSPSSQPCPSLLPQMHLELSGAESIMGAPEVAACQSLLSVVSQLCHAYSCRIQGLEQEVSAHCGHVMALRGELQDPCLRDNLAFIPLEELPADEETFDPVPLSDWSKVPLISTNSTLS